MRAFARGAGLVALAALAGGCGFRLRGWDLAGAFDAARIEAAGGVDLHRDLAEGLRLAGLRVVDADADVVLRLAEQRRSRRTATVTVAGRAAEVELALEVTFAVHAGDGRELAAERRLRSERVARLDGDNIVGSGEEHALLDAEMRADLVGRMLHALNAISRADGPGQPNAD